MGCPPHIPLVLTVSATAAPMTTAAFLLLQGAPHHPRLLMSNRYSLYIMDLITYAD
jgi:hypothetical protein